MKLKYWVPVILWVGFLFLMSTDMFSAQATFPIIARVLHFFAPSISAKEIQILHAILRKLAHVTEYFIFGILLYRAVRSGSLEPRLWRWAFLSLLLVVLLAACDEFHQSFVATRTASVVDVVIDTSGGVLALCASVLWSRWRRQ